MSNKTILLGPILTALPGCVHVEGERPLSAEHDEFLGDLLEREPEATAMAAEMAERMDVGAVDATGASASGHRLAVDIRATGAWLQTEYSAGRVMEADPSRFDTADTVAQYDREAAGTHDDDRIVLDATDTSTWNLPTIMHEAGHRTFSHDLFVTQAIRDSGVDVNEGFADAIIDHGDYAYLITALYMIPSNLVIGTDADIAEARAAADEMARTRGTLAAQKWFASEIAMPSESDMLERVDGFYERFAPCLSAFGLTNEGVRESYLESGMHEALRDRREGAAAEFREEHRAELRGGKRLR